MAPGSTTFAYNSIYWTTSQTLNDGYTTPVVNVDVKLSAYNSATMTGLKICAGNVSLPKCYTYHFGFEVESALVLWGHAMPARNVLGSDATGYVATPGLHQQMFEELWDVDGNGYHVLRATHQDCMQRPGINTACRDGNRVRFGFCGNLPAQGCQSGDGDDADFAIGIGGTGQDAPMFSAQGSTVSTTTGSSCRAATDPRRGSTPCTSRGLFGAPRPHHHLLRFRRPRRHCRRRRRHLRRRRRRRRRHLFRRRRHHRHAPRRLATIPSS